MGAGSPFSLRGHPLPRLTIVFVLVLVLYYFNDLWFPSVPATDAGWPVLHHDEPQSVDPDDLSVTPNSVPQLEETRHNGSSSESPGNTTYDPPNVSCKEALGGDKVMVMLKTGASELYQKLPTHFVTTFQCVPNFMIFSDLEQEFAGVPVYDAIAPVSESIREGHDDFKLYREIAKWQREGQDLSRLKGDGGWNLDKWKFLPMLHHTFDVANDDIRWFVMIEADTSMSWTNLLQWLQTMDPTEPLYLGAQNQVGDTIFGHGGSGIVISRAAADKLKGARDQIGHEKYDLAWEEVTGRSCCGDEIVALAFNVLSINLTASWPLLQGETVSTVDWTSNHWCTPPITWHHVSPIEIDSLWQFESKWVKDHGWNEPYLYRDVFAHFVDQHISVNRTNWNNRSKDRRLVRKDLADEDDAKWDELRDWEQAAVESESACAGACREAGDRDCIQWMFTPGRCYLGRDIRFGQSDERDDEHYISGWMQDRVAAFRHDKEDCAVRWAG